MTEARTLKTAINHTQIIIGNGQLIEEGSILFDESGILDIGDKVTFSGDTVIDGKGKTVLPGFIDSHVHLCFPPYPWTDETRCNQDPVTVGIRVCNQARELLKSGITTARVAGTMYGADLQLRKLVQSGEVKAPRIKASGEVICITAGHCSELGIACDTVDQAVTAARSLIAKKVDAIKMMATGGVIGIGPIGSGQLSPAQIAAICAEGKRFGKPTFAHLSLDYECLTAAIKAGITSVEHGNNIDDAAAKLMVEQGTYYVPTMGVKHNEAHNTLTDPTSIQLREKAALAQKGSMEAVRIAVKWGVKMAVGTDNGCPFTNPDTYAYSTEMCLFEQVGMKKMDVIQCATINGAKLLGIDHITGSLQRGKCADITVINGDPLEDLSATRNVMFTYCAGKLYYKA